MEVPTIINISRSLKKIGCDCERNSVPLDGNPGRRDKGKDYCFKLNKRVKIIGVVFTVSLRNIIS